MTKEIVKYMCEGKSAEQIAKDYKKSVLLQMYVCLYTIEPQGNKTAYDLAYSIWYFLSEEERTADLCKLLH